MLRLPTNQTPDPRHRYHAIAGLKRSPENAIERALLHVLDPKAHPATKLEGETLKSVRAACASFQNQAARYLFDACLLGRATPEELEEAFGVTRGETAAYATLFFDRGVFDNDFHVIGYIAQESDPQAHELLKEGFTKGFRALRFKYASEPTPPSPEATLQRIFEADAQTYMQHRATPLTNRSVKEVRALGKHVIATAQALDKVKAPVVETARDDDTQFVLENSPANPTLDELLAAGAKLAH